MGFYDLDKDKRLALVDEIRRDISHACISGDQTGILNYYADTDTYIRKNAYLVTGRLFDEFRDAVLHFLSEWKAHPDFKVRQTVVNAAGEIGMKYFELVQHFFDTGLFDIHPAVRNAVIGSVKKMGKVNPTPVLSWAEGYLLHEDKEVRREICHGIELRGRTHPQDILPLLRTLQFEKKKRVRNTLVHVIGQISYKKGCLPTVLETLMAWENTDLVKDALIEIVDVHVRYRNFSYLTAGEAATMIAQKFQSPLLQG